ncbi:hypothetical protein HDU85_003351 [Gaertneriomyces sp. JEL0708]|nr:hypothetical protein HDU85_003351 [Gaertneriomyces sp. JEL0708]
MADATTVTSESCRPERLEIQGRWFKDSSGRVTMLRGVNLSGNCKLPSRPYMPSHISTDFFDDVNISFVGRPFPLEEADEHLLRLRGWGVNFLRLLVTWEALEHRGPGIYDYEFIHYIVQVLQKCKQHGIRVMIDPHQDVWSRFSGGSGAPGWTFRAAGLDFTKFAATEAAIVHNVYSQPELYPAMIWPTNAYKLAAATMFTLFFAGRIFAPQCEVQGINIETYLQSHFFNAFSELASCIQKSGGLEENVVVGYDTLNEPGRGWIGCADLSKLDPLQELRKGVTPSPFQAMLLGEGITCEVECWEFTRLGSRKRSTTHIDPVGISAWLPGSGGCVWARHGVWDRSTQRLLRSDYFTKNPNTGESVDYINDCWMPFVRRFVQSIRAVHSDAVIFVEPPVNEHPPTWDPSHGDPQDRLCYAPHWYDGLTLINKHFNRWLAVDYLGYLRGKYPHIAFAVKVGNWGVAQAFRSQLKLLRDEGNYPVILGETGIPFDMDKGRAYKSGDYSLQTMALDCIMHACESNLLNVTWWNYCPDNTHAWGDGWNGEDLSLWSSEGIPGK